ncbi:MAG: hypothetical protein IJA94_05575 [Bacilli bacterium]|nr:hypothetical protein [Bacilli bacterium]
MHAKIIDLINLLVKMSGEKDNFKNLSEELTSLDNLLPELKNELEALTLSITDDKYFDASSEIIDRNIELSLKKKINNLQEALNNEKEKIELVSKKTEESVIKYDLLNKRIASCESFINILNSRFQNDNEVEEDSKYFRLLEQEKLRYEALNAEINDALKNKEDLLLKLEELEQIKENIQNNLNNEKKQLEEVKQSLADKSSYIDVKRKEEDLNKVKDIETKIENTEKRKEEILESIAYKAEQSKNLLLSEEEDKTEFLSTVSEITNKLNNLPYQSIEDEAILREELRQLESKKDELTTLIENKKYASSDLNVIEGRINYLESKSNLITKEVEAYKSLESLIADEEIIKLTDILIALREKAQTYEIAFSEYELSSNTDKDYDLELEKYNLLNEIITNYENDLQNLISLSNNLNYHEIAKCESQLNDIQEEKDYLNKKKLLHSESINVIEKEKDRKELKDLVDNIERLNSRLRVGITPNQVLDQIEMLLFAGEEKVDAYAPETPVTETEVIKNIEMVPQIEEPIIEPKQEIKTDFTFEKIPNEELPILDDLVPKDMIINPTSQNAEIFSLLDNDEQKDFSFSPLDNTGFMSFDDALDIAKNN